MNSNEFSDGVFVREIIVTHEGYFKAYEFLTNDVVVFDPVNYVRILRGEIINGYS